MYKILCCTGRLVYRMAYRRFLTQKELVEAMEEITLEQEEGKV